MINLKLSHSKYGFVLESEFPNIQVTSMEFKAVFVLLSEKLLAKANSVSQMNDNELSEDGKKLKDMFRQLFGM